MEIVEMTSAHVGEIAALEKACFSSPWSEKSIAGELTNPLALWIVATVDHKVVGYVGTQSVMNEADMMNLAVDENHRRMGIARALVEKLVALLRNNGVYALMLEVRKSNAAAISLYESMGFIQVGCRPNYYSNPREDALILRKEWEV